MSTASVDVFSGPRALVASAVDPRAIRGPGLAETGLDRAFWVESRSELKGQRGGERVRARAMRGIGCEARFRAHSASHPYTADHNMTGFPRILLHVV